RCPTASSTGSRPSAISTSSRCCTTPVSRTAPIPTRSGGSARWPPRCATASASAAEQERGVVVEQPRRAFGVGAVPTGGGGVGERGGRALGVGEVGARHEELGSLQLTLQVLGQLVGERRHAHL